jgi:hypothetical protein
VVSAVILLNIFGLVSVGVQVGSYAFLFPNELGMQHRMLLPVVDLVNHGDGGRANANPIQADNGDIYVYTLRDIAKGEEVRLIALMVIKSSTRD